ncbi:DUF4129 domain-containing protein [Deinococcus sp.]|uniref:DUF4129 domain-containing protein n=1 Tax=Deinococcus sp. TaxID=47478 RepID=UPI003C7D9E59
MSVPSTAPPRNAGGTRPYLRPWLAALLPFTALGLLPWWACLALSVSLALGRLNDDSRSIGALIVLLAAVLVSGPLLLGGTPGRLPAAGTLFGQAAVVGLLALASLRALEHGQRRGLLLPVAALLLSPGPGGLAALLLAGLSLNGAETGLRLRLASTGQGRMGWLLPLTVLLISGAALLLQTALPGNGLSTPAHTTAAPGARPHGAGPAAAPTARPQPTGGHPSPPAASPSAAPEDQAVLLRPLVPLTGLLIVTCLLLLIQRVRLKRAERRSHWTDYAAILAMLGTLFMVGVLGAGAGPGGVLSRSPLAAAAATGGRTGPAPAGNTRPAPSWIAPLLNAGILFSTLFFAVAAVYLCRTLRAERTDRRPARPTADPAPRASVLPPLHRVRLAWRGLETVLAAAGLARGGSETPEEFSARLTGLLPMAAADLHTLLHVYLPVRYGGELSEDAAARAEASARSIQAAVRDLNAVI